MAGVRKTKKSGKYHGWYYDHRGKRKYFSGTPRKKETLDIAQRLEDEHRQIRLGYRPVPSSARKYVNKPVLETVEEYICWGKRQGGRGGRPWGIEHAFKKEQHLNMWADRLKLQTLSDLDNLLSHVNAILKEFQSKSHAGSTIRNKVESLNSFCNWCIKHGYLDENPLKDLGMINKDPKTKRRALTIGEIGALLEVAPDWRRLLYAVALCTGLRARELRSLTRYHLDVKQSGLRLEAAWTKNRKPGFQPLPQRLVQHLLEFSKTDFISDMYYTYYRKFTPPKGALLYVPSHPAREIDKDLKAAGIPKKTREGKLDFHALRTAYITLTYEMGATTKEAQALARHSSAHLTENVYARTRDERLCQITEDIGDVVLPARAKCVPNELGSDSRKRVKSFVRRHILNPIPTGGGGIRTATRFLQKTYINLASPVHSLT
ncbi:tyrosine-type recombinase/integrase [Planctomycetota bacterium]